MEDSGHFQAFLNQEFERLITRIYGSDPQIKIAVDELIQILLEHLRNPQKGDLQGSLEEYYTKIVSDDIIDADLIEEGKVIIESSRPLYDNAMSKLKKLFSQPTSILAATAAAFAAVAASLSTPAVMASAAISSAAFSAIRAHYTPTSGTSDSEVRQLLMYAILQYSFDMAKLHDSADSYRGGDDEEQRRRADRIRRYNGAPAPGAAGSAPAGGAPGATGSAPAGGSPGGDEKPRKEQEGRAYNGSSYRSKKKQKSRRNSYRKRNRTRKKRTRQTRARKKRTRQTRARKQRTRGKTYS